MVNLKKYVAAAAVAMTAAMPFTQAHAESHGEGVKIAVVGGSNEDAFWNLIKKGIDDARVVVEANGGEVNYLRLVNYDNFAPDVVQLIRTAIGQEVDGLVIPNWVPEAEDPAIRDAIEAGIKVILMNAGGIEKANELGAINYVGSDEYEAGVAGGKYFVDNGQTNVICVNLAGVLTFLAQGLRPRTWWEAERAKKATRVAVVTWSMLLLVLVALILLAVRV